MEDGVLVVAGSEEHLYGFAPGRPGDLEDPAARPGRSARRLSIATATCTWA